VDFLGRPALVQNRARGSRRPGAGAAALKHRRFHGIAQDVARTTLFRLRLGEKTGRCDR
jgi:hypothetical protein